MPRPGPRATARYGEHVKAAAYRKLKKKHEIMRVSASGLCAAISLCAMVGSVHAHHSNTAYDTGKSVEWRVVVTEFKFVNPHAYVFFTSQDENGRAVEGRCELSARTMLTRMGWTADTLKPGEKVTIKGAPGRNEANVCLLESFMRANGAMVGAHQQLGQ